MCSGWPQEEITAMSLPSCEVLVCADLSMNRPGFACLAYNGEDRGVRVLRMSHVDNKKNEGRRGKRRKPHGQILSEIASE